MLNRLVLLVALVVALCGGADAHRGAPFNRDMIEATMQGDKQALHALNFPFPTKGVVNPGRYYQRYRRSEYPAPFFQWWFFWIRDTATNNHYTFTYAMSSATEPKENGGAFLGFSAIPDAGDPNKRSGANTARIDRYDLGELVADAKAPVYYNMTYANESFLNPVSDDVYHLRGRMPAKSKRTWGCFDQCAADGGIEWDLTVTRRLGWFGEEGTFEKLSKWAGKGMIGWDTYAHDSLVEGTLKIGGKTLQISSAPAKGETTPRWLAYGDGNWGHEFPHGPSTPPAPGSASAYNPERSPFAWGWYSANSPKHDVAIIAGLGLTETTEKGLFAMKGLFAGFADIRISNHTRISARYITGRSLSETPWKLVHTSNDGDCTKFDVERTNWANMTIPVNGRQGGATKQVQIPLHQVLTIQTGHYRVQLTFKTVLENFTRLLFPFQNIVFSDFEALGVKCHAVIGHSPSGFATEGDVETILDFVDEQGGLEYGRSF